ncbi:MAG: hypothetical protein QM642_11415 [Edaphocola sp.]
MPKKILSLFITLLPLFALGQATTSPYSILGIGDIETKDFGKFFGMSSATTAMRSTSFVNINNAASLTALDPSMLNIDINARWRSSAYRMANLDTFTKRYNDGAFRRFSITFRPSDKWGLSLGLRPYSSVNYSLQGTMSLGMGETTDIAKSVSGTGGLNQAYVANGFKLNKNFSVGATASFLFGSIKRSTLYYQSNLGLNLTRNEYQNLKAFNFGISAQYVGKLGDHFTNTIGFTASVPTKIMGTAEVNYIESDSTVTTTYNDNYKPLKLPLEFNLGYALTIDNQFTFSFDYGRKLWDEQKLSYPNSKIMPTQRAAFGFQYSKQQYMQGQVREKYFFQAGASYEESYLSINGKQLLDISGSVGAGVNVNRLVNVYLGIEVGSRGSKSRGQITENYTQVGVGITLKEFWINTKKLRLYP